MGFCIDPRHGTRKMHWQRGISEVNGVKHDEWMVLKWRRIVLEQIEDGEIGQTELIDQRSCHQVLDDGDSLCLEPRLLGYDRRRNRPDDRRRRYRIAGRQNRSVANENSYDV